jgi:hypothetical protein
MDNMGNELQVVNSEQLPPVILTPQQQVDKASEMAKVLQTVVKQADLARNFGGKKNHLEYEAWQTIAQFFDCTPVTEWTKPIKDKDSIIGWEARVAVHNGEGRIIATAENMCMRDEPNWKSKPNYALRSMAQTRAAGKALRSVFAFVAVLAGYSATPSEEMDSSFKKQNHNGGNKNYKNKKSLTGEMTTKQKNAIVNIAKKSRGLSPTETEEVVQWYAKSKGIKNADKQAASELIGDFGQIYDDFLKKKASPAPKQTKRNQQTSKPEESDSSEQMINATQKAKLYHLGVQAELTDKDVDGLCEWYAEGKPFSKAKAQELIDNFDNSLDMFQEQAA